MPLLNATTPYQRITKLGITIAKQITTGLNHDRTIPDLTHAELLSALLYPTDAGLDQTALYHSSIPQNVAVRNCTIARPCLALRHNTIAERDTAQQYHCYTLRRTTRPGWTIPSLD